MRPHFLLLPLLLAGATAPACARTLQADVARVRTPVATMEGVQLQLDWPAQAREGVLELRARRIDAPDLGYAWRDLAWRCPLRRDGQGGWLCDGVLQAGRGESLRLALALGPANTDAVLSRGRSRLSVARTAASPDFTAVELAAVPAAWAQALLATAWPEAQLRAGTLDGRLDVHSPGRGPLRIAGILHASELAFDTPDATVAGEGLSGRFEFDYRSFAARSLVTVDGTLRGGQFLAGNTYVALPTTPIDVRVDAEQDTGAGWRIPHFSWHDGGVVQAEGSAAFDADANLREFDATVRSDDLTPVRDRYLSGWLGLAGLGDLQLRGALDASVRIADGELRSAQVQLHAVDIDDPIGRFRFAGLDGAVRFSADADVDSALRWREGALYGLAFGGAELPLVSGEGRLRLRESVGVPMLGGMLHFDDFALRPRNGDVGAEASFGLRVDRLDIGQLAQALDWPAFRGELSGRLPRARYANERLDFEGGLSMSMFGGRVDVASLSMERPFGVAPTLTADLTLDDLDLLALTEVFDFGSITGRLDGSIAQLRLVDWSVTAFEADLHTDPAAGVRQRISQRAVQNISSVGDTSFITTLQGRLIGLFDDFGYARIGIGCRLANEVCEMHGLRSAGNTFAIVDGAGLPRLSVVGHNRRVDWPTLVERLSAVGKGDVAPVVE